VTIPKPKFIYFLFYALIPTITWLVYVINPDLQNGYLVLFLAFYFSIMLLITDYRVRYNKSILKRDLEVYQIYSDFRTSHSIWTAIMPILFPVFYIPYLFWYYRLCKKMRRQSRPCKQCANGLDYKLDVISEIEDDKYLSKGQIK
jgi:uncharacterized membrane protein